MPLIPKGRVVQTQMIARDFSELQLIFSLQKFSFKKIADYVSDKVHSPKLQEFPKQSGQPYEQAEVPKARPWKMAAVV